MGGKESKGRRASITSLNPNERRKLTAFLESSGSNLHFNHAHMQKLWKDLLVPDLLQSYADFLMKQDISNKKYIGLDEFVMIYSYLIRGDSEEKASTIANIIGTSQGSAGQAVTSFAGLCKYLSDLLESYFIGLRQKNDTHFKSWTYSKQPERSIIEQIMKGVCSDLPRKNDEVQVHDMEQWLNYTGMVSVLHSYVLGSLYNLEPEIKATIIPLAVLPSTKTPTFLDLSQIVYLNSFVPSEYKAKWRFLFSTATHGESFSKLVGCIMNQGPLVFVMESDDYSTFGGFISESVAPGPRWVGSEDCFIFKLNPSVEVYPATGYNDHYVYLNMNQASLPNGLGMGGQYNYWGLWIDSIFGQGECSDSCTTYKNYKILSSKKKFHINKLEVWGVGNPPLSAEERGERTSGAAQSILNIDTAASHILEMAGHKTYSKGLKESPEKD